MNPIQIIFYDEILPGDAARVLAQLQAAPQAAVEVRINSPGGSVAEGLAIFNALKPRRPTVFIDGIAASIASLIAMAGARIVAAENAIAMVHLPWAAGAEGNATALRKTADLLDKHATAMLSAYSRTKLPQSKLIDMLSAETWMTAQEALALGFVDEIAEPLAFAAHAPACFAGYKHTPPEILMPSNPSNPAGNTQPPAPVVAPGAPASTSAPTAQPSPSLGLSPSEKADNSAIMGALRQRNDSILAIAEPFKNRASVQAYVTTALADPSVGIEDYRHHMLALIGREATPLGSAHIEAGNGASDFVTAASDSIAIRAGVTIAKPHPGARDIQGMSTFDLMRSCVSRSGRIMDLGSRSAIVHAAMSTSDFPAILENSLHKALRSGFEVEPATIDSWCSKVMVPDFKPQSRVILGSAPDLDLVPELGEYKEGSLDEDKSLPYQVQKFGKIIRFSWESLVGDDLNAFMRVTSAMGQAARRAEADAIYATLGENSGAGPAMQDSNNLFSSAHANLAASAAGITADSLNAARVLLRRQTAVGGGAMNIVPRFLLIAPEQEQQAETLLAASARGLSQGSSAALVPAWLSQLQLVVESRLTGNAFYVLSAPTSVDTLERAWLDDDNGPAVFEEETSFNIDARSYKIRFVFGARWLDWRGAVKVPLS